MVDKKNLKQRKMGHKLVSDGGAKRPKGNKNKKELKKELKKALENKDDVFNLKELEKALKNIVRKNTDLNLDTKQILPDNNKRERKRTQIFEPPKVSKSRNSAQKKRLTKYLNDMNYIALFNFVKDYIDEINTNYGLVVSPENKENIIENILNNNDKLSIKLRHKGYAEAP